MRLMVVVEGATEADFVTRVLQPHFEKRTNATLSLSAPKLDGHQKYSATRKFIKTLLHSKAADLRVSTMVDLFKLPRDFPGRKDLSGLPPLEYVRAIEEKFAEDIGESRFHPYLQLHEFEALVLVDLLLLAERYPDRRRAVAELHKQIHQSYKTPEYVNGQYPPSYQIKKAVPEYNKRLDGVDTVLEIGLERLRSACKHFGSWVDLLETL